MKNIFFSVLVISFFISISVADAEVGTMDHFSRFTNQTQIGCSGVTDDQFEETGDFFISSMLKNQEQRKAIDDNLKGEKSENLRQAYVSIGRSYLGCPSDYDNDSSYKPMMMGYGLYNDHHTNSMMGHHDWGSSLMSGFSSFLGFIWITMILVWILFILVIVLIVKWIRK